MKLRIKNTDLTLKIIGWVQIIGGIIGIGAIGYILLQTETISGILLLLILIGIFLFSFSIFSGQKILTEPQNSAGIKYSLINQFIQLFQWGIFGYKMSVSAGLTFCIGFDKGSLVFNFTFITFEFNLSIRSGNDAFFKINLVALLIILALFDILKEYKTECTAINNALVFTKKADDIY
jgi:hypothetical protein